MRQRIVSLICVCVLVFGAPLSVLFGPHGGTVRISTIAAQETETPSKASDPCQGTGWDRIPCKIVTGLVGAFFSITISLAGSFMSVTGWLFDTVVDILVVNLGSWLKGSHVLTAIEHVWSIFRDIGNILMIGMFVFIALRTILGVDSSSNKQLVINIILVALLINFSLFFVKAALDVTNFFSYQFYKNISSVQVTENGKSEQVTTGVAARFGTLAGASRVTANSINPFTRLYGAADQLKQGRPTDSWNVGAIAIRGTGITLMYLGAAIVFGYGAVLILIRGIMLIILMITSSLAFTAYILPSPAIRKYFDQWKDALIQNAIFGPLLMILLWASISIADALVGMNGGGKNVNQGGIVSLINYAFVLGFMYASIKIAQSLASKTDTSMFGLKPRTLVTGAAGWLAGRPFAAAASAGRALNMRNASAAVAKESGELKRLQSSPQATRAQIDAQKKVLEAAQKRMKGTGDFRSDSALAKWLQKQGVNMGTANKDPMSKTVKDKNDADTKYAKERAEAISDAIKGAATQGEKDAMVQASANYKEQQKAFEERAAAFEGAVGKARSGSGETGDQLKAAIQTLTSQKNAADATRKSLTEQLDAAKAQGQETKATLLEREVQAKTADISRISDQINVSRQRLDTLTEEVARTMDPEVLKDIRTSMNAVAEAATAQRNLLPRNKEEQAAKEKALRERTAGAIRDALKRDGLPEKIITAAEERGLKDAASRKRDDDRELNTSLKQAQLERATAKPTAPATPAPAPAPAKNTDAPKKDDHAHH